MTSEQASRRIRLDPSKFWAATRSMTPEEKETLLEAVQQLVEKADLHGLSQFNFVSFEEPGSEKQPARRKPAEIEHEWEPGSDGRHHFNADQN